MDLFQQIVLLGITAGAAVTDVKSLRIPNALTASGAVIGLVLLAFSGLSFLLSGVAISVFTGGVLMLLKYGFHLAAGRDGLGMGDIKLLSVIALFTGWEVLWILYLASLSAIVYTCITSMGDKTRLRRRVPFAPFIVLATFVNIFLLPAGYLFYMFSMI